MTTAVTLASRRAAPIPTTTGTQAHQQADLMNRVSGLSMKLHALLSNTYGGSGESFRDLNDDLQDAYLWACASLAGELENAVTELGEVKA